MNQAEGSQSQRDFGFLGTVPAVYAKPPDLELAYTAGLIDGEGAITVSSRKTRNTKRPDRFYFPVSVAVTSSTPILLHWLHDRWGGHISKPIIAALRRPDFMPMRGNKLFSKPYSAWSVSYALAGRFLEDIEPFLILKREMARNAIHLSEIQRTSRGGHTDAVYAAQLACLEKHRKLSPRGKGYRYGTATEAS